MSFSDFTIQDWITIILLIGQAGVIYHRLKKVEQVTEKFTELMVSLAVLKNSFENHKVDFENFKRSTGRSLEKIDERVSGMETHAYQILSNHPHNGRSR